MLCKVQIEAPMSCCIPVRYVLITWGYLKMIATVLLLSCFVKQITVTSYFLLYSTRIVFGLLAVQLIADIMLQSLLVTSYYKKADKELKAYYIYTKVLFALSVVLGLAYAVIYVNDMDLFTDDRYNLEELILAYIITTFVSAVIQAILWHTIMKNGTEHDASKPERVFKVNFTVQTEASEEKDIENNITVETFETTNQKEKLIA